MNYYNDNDPKAAAWLRELIKAGLIPQGEVDERSITEVQPNDLKRFTQCHFFAGIGGWPYALQLAGWPATEPVWTGSCPCQPLSCAGQQNGEEDERHLWPELYYLIGECRPAIVFGEQVAHGDGPEWLDGISLDLEDISYAIAAADLPGACVGSPQERQRLFWVADSQGKGRRADIRSIRSRAAEGLRESQGEDERRASEQARRSGDSGSIDRTEAVADADGRNASTQGLQRGGQHGQQPRDSRVDETLGDSASAGQQGEWREYRPSGEGCGGLVGLAMQAGVPSWNGPTIAVKCSDGPRRVSAEPGAFPLAHGLPARMGRLRGYGNAIVPQVAAKFIQAYIEAREEIAAHPARPTFSQ